MKNWLFIFISVTAPSCFASELPEAKSPFFQGESVRPPYKKTIVEQFASDLEMYRIESGWVMSTFLSLPLHEFDMAWELFITTLRETPWKFFVGKQQNYSEKKYREFFIAQCAQYHAFLQNLLVDLTDKRIFLAVGSEKTQRLKQAGVITIFQYWQIKKVTLHHHFYAFYFDRVVMQLYETIITASCQLDMPDYPALYKQARKYATELSVIFKQLKGGSYDDRYAYHVKRYQEVLVLLQKERKALVEGGVGG